MAATTDEITIDIDAADAAAAKKAAETAKKTADGAKKTEAEPAVVVDPEVIATDPTKEAMTPEAGLEKLQKQLADEKTARIAAETRANESAQAEARARGDVQKSQLDQIKGAIEQLTQASDVLESQYAEKAAAQDWGGAAKVQRQMATNAARLAQLEAGKTALENAPKPQPRAPTDPVEAFCAQLSAPSAAWVRAHPDFVRDTHKNRQMLAAHELAVARGYKADTDDYFKSIEKTLDVGTAAAPAHADDPDPLADVAATAATGGRRAAPAAAPVSRSGNGAAGRPNIVRLSADEVEMAQNMGMSVEEYARNKVALKKEGKLS